MSMDFVALDVETANYDRGSICSFGLAFVEGGQVVRTENWLNRPPVMLNFFDDFNMALHGITPDRVLNEPTFDERFAQVVEAIGDRPVLCHYAPFDIGAIRDGCDADDLEWPELTYGCTVVLSRRVLSLLSYRLPFVCDELGISLLDHHEAGADATACARIALELARRQEAATLDDLVGGVGVRLGHLGPNAWRGCARMHSGQGAWRYGDTPDANVGADPDHPFYGQVMVFTGAMSLRREDAWAAVAAVGATPEKNVNKRTTMLVIGDGFNGNTLEEFHTGKAEKAIHWQQKGHTIEVLSEGEFFNMLNETAASGERVR